MQQEGGLPKAVVHVSGGALDRNLPFVLHDLDVDLCGVEAGGESCRRTKRGAVSCWAKVLHG